MSKIRFSSDENAYRITLDDVEQTLLSDPTEDGQTLLSDPTEDGQTLPSAPTEDGQTGVSALRSPLHILDIALLEELRDALSRVSNDRHALIIDASGENVFSAGASVQDHFADRVAVMLATFHDCFRMLARLDVVTVAFVRGAALGGGCELAMACDFVLASDRATFGQPEIKLGVFPPVAAYQLSRQLAPRKGLELLLTGESIDATRAEQLGLVNAVFPASEFEGRADDWMQRLYRQSASSLRFAKKAFRIAQAADFDERLASVERLYLEELMKTSDATEGLNAFLEKRNPAWKNR